MVKISVDFTFTLAYSKRLWWRRNDQILSKFQARISVHRGTDFLWISYLQARPCL